MSVRKFRKRPVEIEAIQWTGDNEAEIQAWAGGPDRFHALDPKDRENCDDPDATAEVFDVLHSTWVLVLPGQWVIRGVAGEYYPIAETVLAETYEEVVDEKEEAGMDFGQALEALRAGERVERAGWNGKGMWVALMPGNSTLVEMVAAAGRAHQVASGEPVVVRPYLMMRAVDGSLVPWTISQTDALAKDWAVVGG